MFCNDISFLCSLNFPLYSSVFFFFFNLCQRDHFTLVGVWALFPLSCISSLITLWWQRNDFRTLISPGSLLTWLPDGLASGRQWWKGGRARRKKLEPFLFSSVSMFCGVSGSSCLSSCPHWTGLLYF